MQNQTVDVAGECRIASHDRHARPAAGRVITAALGVIAVHCSLVAPAAAALENVSRTDTIIAGLPGVLIAGLALLFAIRERGRSKALRLALAAQSASFGPPQAVAEEATVALWRTDADGRTVYANMAMRQLLGIHSLSQLDGLSDHTLLQALGGGGSPDEREPYAATLQPLHGAALAVLVFEQRHRHDAETGLQVSRAIIDSQQLSGRLLEQCRAGLSAVA